MAHRVLNISKNLDMTINDYVGPFHIGSSWELSITGTWTGEVSILRRFDTADNWGITMTTDENTEDSNVFKTSTPAYWMVVVSTAGTGTAVIRCVR